MRLLFISNLFPDTREPYRGLDNATLLHYLAEHCEVRVMSPRPALPFAGGAEKICREIDERFSPVYPKVFYIPKYGSRFNHHLFAHAIRRPLLEIKKEFPFDIILVSWTFPDTAAVAKLQRELGVPFVSIVQGSDAHSYLRMPHRREAIVAASNCASSVITRSTKLAELLESAGVAKEKLRPIYNGVDLDLFKPGQGKITKLEMGLSSQMPVILFVGNFYPVKNPQLLVRAHAELCRKFPQLCSQLVMVGGGPLEEEVRRVAAESAFGKHVILAGRKLAPEVARYMQAADVLCLSSDNEGVPNVILEAFASGLRVVSTDVGGIREVLMDDVLGKLVPSRDEPALTDALAKTLSSPADAERIRQYAMNFSWAGTARSYFDLLQGALTEEPPQDESTEVS
jgi:teichuronic acid biosynthesis glycosyltransferase TuaC